jgi:hypothetical protein
MLRRYIGGGGTTLIKPEFHVTCIITLVAIPLKMHWHHYNLQDYLLNLCVRLTTLPPSSAVVMKSGNLNFLEPSGPIQA